MNTNNNIDKKIGSLISKMDDISDLIKIGFVNKNETKCDEVMRIIVLGRTGTGKTSIIRGVLKDPEKKVSNLFNNSIKYKSIEIHTGYLEASNKKIMIEFIEVRADDPNEDCSIISLLSFIYENKLSINKIILSFKSDQIRADDLILHKQMITFSKMLDPDGLNTIFTLSFCDGIKSRAENFTSMFNTNLDNEVKFTIVSMPDISTDPEDEKYFRPMIKKYRERIMMELLKYGSLDPRLVLGLQIKTLLLCHSERRRKESNIH